MAQGDPIGQELRINRQPPIFHPPRPARAAPHKAESGEWQQVGMQGQQKTPCAEARPAKVQHLGTSLGCPPSCGGTVPGAQEIQDPSWPPAPRELGELSAPWHRMSYNISAILLLQCRILQPVEALTLCEAPARPSQELHSHPWAAARQPSATPDEPGRGDG